MNSAPQKAVFLALGSNLGARQENLQRVIDLLNQNPSIELLKKSKFYENPAIDQAGPNDFLNMVLKIQTSLEALELLDFLQEIEKNIDPEREERGRKLARKIDIDILLFADQKINDSRLVVPHPRMSERDFVMQPLLEIEPNVRVFAK